MEPKSFQVTLTQPAADRLLQLLDIAVQAKGLAVAQDALALAGILQAAFKASQDQTPVLATEVRS